MALSLLIVACGAEVARDGGSGESPRVLARGPSDAVDGFVDLPVPLSPRSGPLVVAAGDHIVVYGGFVMVGDAPNQRARWVGDGAVYDVAKGEWTELPDAPFDPPLFRSAAVWTGEEAVVMGTPCGETSLDIEDARCEPGGLAVAAYSPATGAWRTLDPPDLPQAEGINEFVPVMAGAAGWASGRAVFGVSAPGQEHSVLFLDPNAQTWQSVRLPEVGLDKVCVIDETLVAVSTGNVGPRGETGTPSPEAQAQPIRTFEVESGSLRAVERPVTPKPAAEGPLFGVQVGCSADGLVYLPIGQPPTGLDAGALWYDPERKQWVEVPRFGAIGNPGSLAVATLRGTRVLWLAIKDELFIVPEGASEWARAKKPLEGWVRLALLGDLLLVDPTSEQEPPEPLTLALFDPQRFIAAAG